MTTSSELQPTARFQSGRDQVSLPAPLPTSTMDPRYRGCTDHHIACVCREAEHAEEIHELRATLAEKDRLISELLTMVDPREMANRIEQLLWFQERYYGSLPTGGH